MTSAGGKVFVIFSLTMQSDILSISCLVSVHRSDVGDRPRHGDESADDEETTQREEANSRRAERRQVLRPAETQQQRSEEVTRLTQGTRGRDRDTCELSREGERNPTRTGGDTT